MASWYQLLGILDAARSDLADERARRPVACPNDGEPLIEAGDGRLFCRFDGYTPGSYSQAEVP